MVGSSLLLLFGRFGQVSQSVEAPGPEPVEEPAQPVHLRVVGPVQPAGPVAALDDQLGFPQDTQVL
jgi:hypothetical protein